MIKIGIWSCLLEAIANLRFSGSLQWQHLLGFPVPSNDNIYSFDNAFAYKMSIFATLVENPSIFHSSLITSLHNITTCWGEIVSRI